MNCKAFRNYLEEVQNVDALGSEALEHAALCAACRLPFKNRRALAGLVAELERVTVPVDFHARLRARLSSGSRQETGSIAWLTLRGWKLAAVTSAVVILLACVSLMFLRTGRSFKPIADGATVPSSSNGLAEESPKPAAMLTTQRNGDEPGFVSSGSAGEAKSESPKRSVSRRIGLPHPDGARRVIATDFALTEANVVRSSRRNGSQDNGSPWMSIPVPSERLSITVGENDRRLKSMPLRPVTFGTQQFIDGPLPRRGSSSQGIW
jgi:hypothetical protein